MTEYYDFTRQKMFNRDRINGIDVYVLTAYFIDPRRICRSKKNPYRKEDCKANGLWLQNGTHPIHDSFLSSIKETEITSTKWVQGQCFPTMGKDLSITIERDIKYLSRNALLVRQSP